MEKRDKSQGQGKLRYKQFKERSTDPVEREEDRASDLERRRHVLEGGIFVLFCSQ